MKAHYILSVGLIFSAIATNAMGMTISEKYCVFKSAHDLITMPDVIFKEPTIENIDAQTGARNIVMGLGSDQNAIDTIDRTFWFFDGATLNNLKNLALSGNHKGVADTLISSMLKEKIEYRKVQLNIKAIGLESSFSSYCAFDNSGSYLTTKPIISK